MAGERKRLEDELALARHELQDLEGRLLERPELELGEGSAGVDLWEMALARKKRLRTRVEELELALDRTTEGAYGRCQRCGRGISPERLDALPTTQLCAECALAAGA